MAKLLSNARCFGGFVKKFEHASTSTNTPMKFSVFLPPQAEHGKVPALYWLSGLTCTEDNFIQKAGACKAAAEHGIALICPDTSPRGANIEGEEDGWDFGTGAGFYVNATEEKWSKNYNMFDYVTKELVGLCEGELPLTSVRSISGHSMGGHGALVCFLKNPGAYTSVSAFAPICNPINCPWGVKAFGGYLGSDKSSWKSWDATELIGEHKGEANVLIDQGTEDGFYKDKQLLTENFSAAASKNSSVNATVRLQEGYDHSYWFIQTFMEDHISFHSKFLNKRAEEQKQ